MEYVEESLLISREEITPIPEVSGFCLGLMASRDHVFLAVDLPQLLGFSPLSIYSRDYHIVIVNISTFLDQSLPLEREIFLGLAVNQIEGMTRLTREQILPPQTTVSTSIIPYLSGVVKQEHKLIPILELNEVVKTLAKSSVG
jgi:twitching motility protein PilI